jgi:hypothetical protein
MKSLKIVDWPSQRFYSETHPFHKWKSEFKENGVHIQFLDSHLDKKLPGSDYLLIHSRYFEKGKNIYTEQREDQDYLINYLTETRRNTAKLIWFDASDSSGSSDFSLIPFVDIFLKKQVLKDLNYYTNPQNKNELRIWLNQDKSLNPDYPFPACPADQLKKIRLGWNLGFNDYRYFGYKMSRLSNYLSYGLYPLKFSNPNTKRALDLTFRGTIHKEENGHNKVMQQRNATLNFLGQLDMKIASGSPIPKINYWKELRNSKLSVSPYGWGEVCYRDFETFVAGSLLVKPSMEHLITFPDVYKPFETYFPVAWDMNDLPEALECLQTNYSNYREIAQQGQQAYKTAISDGNSFVTTFLKAIA